MFSQKEIFPGIFHITDAMGVSMTLIEGSERAVLFDTGYGTEDVQKYIRTLTDRPVTVILSHGHHDHILGARWFGKVYLAREDRDEYLLRTGRKQRERVAAQAGQKGVPPPDDFLTASCPDPEPIAWTGKTAGFDCAEMNMGGLPLTLIRVPGHTPGSLMVWIPERRLMLTGDNWNPCTWLWFPSAVPASEWRENMGKILEACPCEHVLCSHQPDLRTGEEMRRFITSLTPERLKAAKRIPLDEKIDTRQAFPDGEGMTFVFDWAKTGLDEMNP